jgi:hypothetical protein
MKSIHILKVVATLTLGSSLGLTASIVQAQEVGRVVSLTPNVRQVQVPKQVCTTDVYRNQTCTDQLVTENVNDGFNVVYEFDGRLFSMYSPNDPGPYVQVNVAPQQYVAPPTVYVQPPVYRSGYSPSFSHGGYPLVHAPVIIRPHGFSHGHLPRPAIVIRGGNHHNGHHGHHGVQHGRHGGGHYYGGQHGGGNRHYR